MEMSSGLCRCAGFSPDLRPDEALAVSLKKLFGQAEVSRTSLGIDVVQQDRLAEARALAQPDVSRHLSFENLLREVRAHLFDHLIAEIVPNIEHGQDDSLILKLGV